MERFRWTTFDVRRLLPDNWQAQLLDLAATDHHQWTLYPVHSTSREAPGTPGLLSRSVSGDTLQDRAPWMTALYQTTFRELAEEHSGSKVLTMSDRGSRVC